MKNIVLPDTNERSLAFYLAMEEFVAGQSEGDSFFVWRVSPTVIIGRNQDLEAEVNLDYCRSHDVKVVRRKSGGGCVYSDMGNIMISYVSERGQVSEVFERYLSALTVCLRSLGLDAEKSGRNDVLVKGRKVSGNAFQQLPGKSIVHGTMLYSTDLDALTEAIRPPLEKLSRHGVESVRQRVVNLQEYKHVHPVLSSVESLEDYIVKTFTCKSQKLTPGQVDEIERQSLTYMINI
jgi:lipoyltransferase/lipoate-protein ligase